MSKDQKNVGFRQLFVHLFQRPITEIHTRLNRLAWKRCPLTRYNFLHLRAPLLYMLPVGNASKIQLETQMLLFFVTTRIRDFANGNNFKAVSFLLPQNSWGAGRDEKPCKIHTSAMNSEMCTFFEKQQNRKLDQRPNPFLPYCYSARQGEGGGMSVGDDASLGGGTLTGWHISWGGESVWSGRFLEGGRLWPLLGWCVA